MKTVALISRSIHPLDTIPQYLTPFSTSFLNILSQQQSLSISLSIIGADSGCRRCDLPIFSDVLISYDTCSAVKVVWEDTKDWWDISASANQSTAKDMEASKEVEEERTGHSQKVLWKSNTHIHLNSQAARWHACLQDRHGRWLKKGWCWWGSDAAFCLLLCCQMDHLGEESQSVVCFMFGLTWMHKQSWHNTWFLLVWLVWHSVGAQTALWTWCLIMASLAGGALDPP